MLSDYLKFLKSASKRFVKGKNIWDIILYGSVIRNKDSPSDVDIVLIFMEESLNDRLIISQEFKQLISKEIKNLDVKSINLGELFDSNFLARQGILAEGYSLIRNKFFSEILGFQGLTLFTYHLKNLDHNSKTKFTYSLIGRNTEGIFKKVGAKRLGKGAVVVPVENSDFFEEFLKKWKVNYSSKKILIEK